MRELSIEETTEIEGGIHLGRVITCSITGAIGGAIRGVAFGPFGMIACALGGAALGGFGASLGDAMEIQNQNLGGFYST